MVERNVASAGFTAAELNSLRALQRSLPADRDVDDAVRQLVQQRANAALKARGRPIWEPGGEAASTSISSTPTLATISANSYVWGYNFVLPAAAMSALRDGGIFAELLGVIPPHLEPVIPLVEAHLEDDMASAQAADDGAGVYLTATWTAPEVLVPAPVGTSSITSWLTMTSDYFLLSVYGASTEPGAGLCIWPTKTSDNDDQVWSYVNGFYLQNQKSGLVAEIRDSDPSDGAVIQINNFVPGAYNQQWEICGDGFIRSRMNGNVFSAANDSQKPGTAVVSSPAQLPIIKDPYGTQGWWQNWYSNGSCQNLVTVVANNTPYDLLIQGTPSPGTKMLYPEPGSPAVDFPGGTVAVFMSRHGSENEVTFDMYGLNQGPSASFDAHQYSCALKGATCWVDNCQSAYGFWLTPADCVKGDWSESLPGTILISVEGGS